MKLGSTIFIFGNRKKSADYLYEEEWKTLQENGTITHLGVAFSRDQDKKVYVTHVMKLLTEEIWKAIYLENGYFFVSGKSGNMPRDVKRTLAEILKDKGNISIQDAEAYISNLEKKK